MDVIDFKASRWLNDDKMNEYLRPETLFCMKHFDTYLAESKKEKSSQSSPSSNKKLSETEMLYLGLDVLKTYGKKTFNEWCEKNQMSEDNKSVIIAKFKREGNE